jgi:hypothetical protein
MTELTRHLTTDKFTYNTGNWHMATGDFIYNSTGNWPPATGNSI